MRRAQLSAVRKIGLEEAEAPVPGPGEVLIRPILAGICGSDLSLYLGHRAAPSFPHVLGHEIVGRIEAVGAGVSSSSIGQRVVVEPNYPCGRCGYCLGGRGNICPDKKSAGVSLPGLFSELCVAPAGFAWPVGDGITDADAAAIEPLAVAVHAVRASGLGLGDTVALLGCGAIGLLLIQCALAQGARVLAHDTSGMKLAMARELGALAPADEDIAALWKRENVTRIFETAGVSATVELALASAPRGSEVILLGLASSEASFVPLRFVREGLRLSGSLIYDHGLDFPVAISLVSRGLLRPSLIVTDTLPFARIGEAFELAASGGAAKVLLDMGGRS